MASIEVYSKSSTSISARLIGLQSDFAYTRKCLWVVRVKSNNSTIDNGTTYIEPGNANGGDITLSISASITEYVVSCSVYRNDTGEYLNSFSADVTTSGGGSTEPDEPTWTLDEKPVGDITDTYIDSFYADEYTVYRYEVVFANSGTATFYTEGSLDTWGILTTTDGFDEIEGFPTDDDLANDDESGEGSNFSFTCDVEAWTTYYVWVRCCFGTDSGYIDFYIEPPEASSSDTIKKWTWDSSNGSATEEETDDAFWAMRRKEATTNFSHKVWNDMVDKVKEISDVAVGWWDGTYASYSNTRFLASPYELSADMFNSLRNNLEIAGNRIGLGETTGIGKVETGDIVVGRYFLTLTTYMNDCIDNL